MRNVPDLVEEMRSLLTAFAEDGVEYALCGGLAANIYGADRFTIDIDLLVAPVDLEAALAVARRCGFAIDSGVIPLRGSDRQLHRVVKLEPGWEEPLQLDLLIANGGTYADAYESRYLVPQEDVDLWLVALDELIAMKRESDRPIDRQDIDRLS